MKITSGIYKGVNIVLPKSSTIRPTSEKIRMALFNTLGDLILNSTMLDIFAGSGTIFKVADLLNRKWIGIDKELEYCEISDYRITSYREFK